VRVEQEVSRDSSDGRRHDRLNHDAWQLALNYVLTGEDASYKGIKPNAPFAPGSGNWGAWELVARIGQLNIDNDAFSGGSDSFASPDSAISKATAWAPGADMGADRL
jgi:phosphate-selective porin OprO/OprP